MKNVTVDIYGPCAWITSHSPIDSKLVSELKAQGIQCAVGVIRSHDVPDSKPEVLWGNPPKEFIFDENGRKYLIRPLGHHHPGLFLDQVHFRNWLHKNSKGLKVLNTFSYTGSLSVAAGLGGANRVVSIDLSKPFTEWAQENWKINSLPIEKSDFIYGDVFQWLPKLQKRGEVFDLVICDPPTFARSDKKVFSTEKDLDELIELHLGLVGQRGLFYLSINTANISRDQFFKKLESTVVKAGRKFKLVHEFGGQEWPYLKSALIRLD